MHFAPQTHYLTPRAQAGVARPFQHGDCRRPRWSVNTQAPDRSRVAQVQGPNSLCEPGTDATLPRALKQQDKGVIASILALSYTLQLCANLN